MPDVHELFPNIDSQSPDQLRIRYIELKERALAGTILSDEELNEMVVILGALRRKSAGPPKSPKVRQPLTLADL